MFDVTAFPAKVQKLLSPEREMPLDRGTPNKAARAALQALLETDVVDGPIADADMARACLSALWLYHDFLDESHALSQEIHTTTGSLWHGVMHRREGDYDNAKYWFRRVGSHPVFETLQAEARATLPAEAPAELRKFVDRGTWDPFRFVDLCESACDGRDEWAAACRCLQAAEFRVAYEYSFESARRRT